MYGHRALKILKISHSYRVYNIFVLCFQIFIHSDVKDLYKYVPQELLPEEYGGKAGPMNDIHSMYFKVLH